MKYRAYIFMNGETNFTRKLELDDALKIVQSMADIRWCAGIIDAELPLADAKVLFANVKEPTCGWEEQ